MRRVFVRTILNTLPLGRKRDEGGRRRGGEEEEEQYEDEKEEKEEGQEEEGEEEDEEAEEEQQEEEQGGTGAPARPTIERCDAVRPVMVIRRVLFPHRSARDD